MKHRVRAIEHGPLGGTRSKDCSRLGAIEQYKSQGLIWYSGFAEKNLVARNAIALGMDFVQVAGFQPPGKETEHSKALKCLLLREQALLTVRSGVSNGHLRAGRKLPKPVVHRTN